MIKFICHFLGTTLTPLPKIIYVCPEDTLMLKCETEGVLLEWNMSIPQYGFVGERFVSNLGSPNVDPLSVNSITFHFIRNSSSPLVVTLTINSVVVDLRVACKQYYQSGVSSNVFVTAVQILTSNNTGKSAWSGIQH